MSEIKAPAYVVPPAFDARGGDPEWKIGALWGGILLVTALICGGAVLPISSFEGSGWPIALYDVWRVTPARISAASLLYALAGALQLRALRRWLPLSRWWIAAVLIGHLAAIAIQYQIDRALPHPFIRPFDGSVVMHNDQARGLGWLLAALALVWVGGYGRLGWGWLEGLGVIAYLLLGTLALPRLLRVAPDPEVAA